MKFKIIDPNTEAYKKVSDFLDSIKALREKNVQTIINHTGVQFTEYVGGNTASSFDGIILGIKPSDPSQKLGKEWMPLKDFDGAYTWNKRSKKGRELLELVETLSHIGVFEEDDLFEKIYNTNKWYAFGYYYEPIKNIILLITPDIDDTFSFTVFDGMIEITNGEYHEILNKGKVIN
jgi:hypothetical protein